MPNNKYYASSSRLVCLSPFHRSRSLTPDLSTSQPASREPPAGWLGVFGGDRLAGWLDWLKTVGWLAGLVGLVLFLGLSFSVEFLLRLPDRLTIHIVHRVELLVGEAPYLIHLIAAPKSSFSPPSRAVDSCQKLGRYTSSTRL
jgi:hypothetical protein